MIFKAWARDEFHRGAAWAAGEYIARGVPLDLIQAIIEGGMKFKSTPFDFGALTYIRKMRELQNDH